MRYPHFSVLSSFQCFIPISVFYPHLNVVSHFSVLFPFQRFILISVFYGPFQCFIPISVSVSAIQFQRFIPTRYKTYKLIIYKNEKYFSSLNMFPKSLIYNLINLQVLYAYFDL